MFEHEVKTHGITILRTQTSTVYGFREYYSSSFPEENQARKVIGSFSSAKEAWDAYEDGKVVLHGERFNLVRIDTSDVSVITEIPLDFPDHLLA